MAPRLATSAPTFAGGGTGKILTPVGADGLFAYGYDVAVQGDGKLVVTGSVSGGFGESSQLAVVRYNADGSLDTSFGTGGKVLTSVGAAGTSAGGYAVKLQSDGKIVVSGIGNGVFMGGADIAVVRFNTDGTLDSTFGTGGKALTNFNPSDSNVGFDVLVQSDGKIVVSGYSNLSDGTSAFVVARYTTTGTLDTAFGSGGKVVTPVDPDAPYNLGWSAALQSDGKILVSGYSESIVGTGQDFALVRYNTDGTLDAGFGTGGRVVTPIGAGSASDAGRAVTVQSDGKILVSGRSGQDFAVVRYNADGTLDTGFGTNGIVLTPVGTGFSGSYDIAVLANGQILVSGYGYGGSATAGDFAVVRYNANGTLDTTFGTGGIVLTPVGPGTASDQSDGMVVQADGKIVVSGYSSMDGDTNIQFAVVRYNANGTLDTTFGGTNTLGGTVAFVEDGAAVVLDANVDITDAELDALNGGLGDYAGASLTLARTGGANAQDVFAFGSSADFSRVGNELRNANGDVFATVAQTSGQLIVSFTGTNVATAALADAVARAITYANSADAPPGSVSIAWSYDRGTGEDNAVTTGASTVTLTAVNDAPTATPSVGNYQQRSVGGNSNFLFSDPDGDTLTLTRILHDGAETLVAALGTTDIVGTYGTLTVQPNGQFRYDADTEGVLAVGETQTDTFTFTMSDPGSRTVNSTYAANVTGSATGNAGANIFLLRDAGHAINGLGGIDTLTFAGLDRGVRVALDGGTAAAITLQNGTPFGTVANVENLTGSDFNDTLTGDAGVNVLIGGLGNDVLRAGSDSVADRLDGGRGHDTLYGGVDDYLIGGKGDDTFFIDGAARNVDGGTGDDRLVITDSLVFGAGDKITNVESVVLSGALLNVDFSAVVSSGLDITSQATDSAVILGTSGNDILRAGSHGDLLIAGAGDDTLIAGASFDTLRIGPTHGRVEIRGFDIANDQLDFSESGAQNLSDLSITQFGGKTVIVVAGQTSAQRIVLTNTDHTALIANGNLFFGMD